MLCYGDDDIILPFLGENVIKRGKLSQNDHFILKNLVSHLSVEDILNTLRVKAKIVHPRCTDVLYGGLN